MAFGLALALGACSTPSEPEPTPTSDDLFSAKAGVTSSINSFFGFLALGASEAAAAEKTDLDVDLESPLALLLSDGIYMYNDDRAKLLAIDEVSVASDEEHAEATVTYELAGSELTERIELVRIAEHDDQPDDYAVMLPKDAVGFDPTGAELLPPDTVYRIGEADVSAAFREAIGWAGTDGTLPRLPAFGGTYPVEITVPGDGGFTDTLVWQTSTFYGGHESDGALAEFAHAHGF
ncbi:hypothetical protein GE115_07925 [Agromyces sp. CFH 90414]|uniref:Uncharacterized protein n=1 Tax=Agromyces agglutinans TaxID=2662258 RepID=A0A6I2F699_9MICO|nr:hypothetical protein [Agromyces agglutinans]MRG59794.1 hypothetical protein [Agromyces agglutinans]